MTATVASVLDLASVDAALATVFDPELDEPITDLGFVRGRRVDGVDVEIHLRLPTSFCAPNFAYLMASDAQDALREIPGVGRVRVYLDDHHDSELINRGLASLAGYVGTFGPEAEESLDELRVTFQRKAHVAAMERACSKLLAESDLEVGDLHRVTLADLPESREKAALIRRRADLGLPTSPTSPVMVDETGRPVPEDAVPIKLRFAKTVRISIDGNAHFCRGLLRTRYPESAGDQAPRAQD
jgi:metal-sulfur cluster biosynthetic enzyme